MTVIPIVVGVFGTITKGLLNEQEDFEMRTNGDHSDYSIIKIGQNTEKM